MVSGKLLSFIYCTSHPTCFAAFHLKKQTRFPYLLASSSSFLFFLPGPSPFSRVFWRFAQPIVAFPVVIVIVWASKTRILFRRTAGWLLRCLKERVKEPNLSFERWTSELIMDFGLSFSGLDFHPFQSPLLLTTT